MTDINPPALFTSEDCPKCDMLERHLPIDFEDGINQHGELTIVKLGNQFGAPQPDEDSDLYAEADYHDIKATPTLLTVKGEITDLFEIKSCILSFLEGDDE